MKAFPRRGLMFFPQYNNPLRRRRAPGPRRYPANAPHAPWPNQKSGPAPVRYPGLVAVRGRRRYVLLLVVSSVLATLAVATPLAALLGVFGGSSSPSSSTAIPSGLITEPQCVSSTRSSLACNHCSVSTFRTPDSSCSNLANPYWGSSRDTFRRLLPTAYDDGKYTPKGWTQDKLYNNFPLPSARTVSLSILSTYVITEDTTRSDFFNQFGQLLAHDILHVLTWMGHVNQEKGLKCSSCVNIEPCFPVPAPDDDIRVRTGCLMFTRSQAMCNNQGPWEQMNELTSFIDGTMVYGPNEEIMNALRDPADMSLLKEGSGSNLPTTDDIQDVTTNCELSETSRNLGARCYVTGDRRANVQIGLTALQTVFFREHNRIARGLKTVNPTWTAESIFQTARKIVGAEIQQITYSEYLPSLLGATAEAVKPYTGYDSTVNPQLSASFSTAAFRFGHSRTRNTHLRFTNTFSVYPGGHLPLSRAFFVPHVIRDEGGIDPLIRGMIVGDMKGYDVDKLVTTELTENLFVHSITRTMGGDLTSLNIQRGRDHGLPSYNAFRERCGLARASAFTDFKPQINDDDVLRTLQDLYGHPDNVDLFVGGTLEQPDSGLVAGPTFTCLMDDTFDHIRRGDRFWYENPGVFTADQLSSLKTVTMAKLFCDNGDSIDTVPQDVFKANSFPADFVQCSAISSLNLNLWQGPDPLASCG